jgi:hypothetical protein
MLGALILGIRVPCRSEARVNAAMLEVAEDEAARLARIGVEVVYADSDALIEFDLYPLIHCGRQIRKKPVPVDIRAAASHIEVPVARVRSRVKAARREPVSVEGRRIRGPARGGTITPPSATRLLLVLESAPCSSCVGLGEFVSGGIERKDRGGPIAGASIGA